MGKNTVVYREITAEDNVEVAKVVRKVLVDLGVPKIGTAYADPSLDMMYDNYNVPKATYFVVEVDGKILGGAGVAQLENSTENICELQKMYFLEEARGRGFGAEMIRA
jgi:putative acetyltransferase